MPLSTAGFVPFRVCEPAILAAQTDRMLALTRPPKERIDAEMSVARGAGDVPTGLDLGYPLNEVALRAVLADIRRTGVDEIICLGDVANLGPAPNAVIELLAELGCPCIMAAFMADQEWEGIKRSTRGRGSLVGQIEDRLLVPTDYSPVFI